MSSTFTDMHGERDHLVKHVFPRLREWGRQRGISIEDVDLRWGVTEEDATANRATVATCLDRIDRCRPFFLCLLGERYGWVPAPEDVGPFAYDGLSLTAMEIDHAISAAARPARLIAYRRDPAWLARVALPDPVRRLYSDDAEPDPDLREALRRGRHRVAEEVLPAAGCRPRTYQASWIPHERTPELALPLAAPSSHPETVAAWRRRWVEEAGVETTGDHVEPSAISRAVAWNAARTAGRPGRFTCEGEPFGDVVVRDLQAAIEAELPDLATDATSTPSLRARADHDMFVDRAVERHVPRPEAVAIDDWLARPAPRPLLVVGPPGCGKSDVLASIVGRLRAARPVVLRAAGVGPDTATLAQVMRSVLVELASLDGRTLTLPPDPGDLRRQWARLLHGVGAGTGAVVIIDGVDQMTAPSRGLAWLLLREIPGLHVIASLRLGSDVSGIVHDAEQRGLADVVRVSGLDGLDVRRRLVRVHLARHLKELDRRHTERLVGLPGAVNPLFLAVALSELRSFGAFDQLTELLDGRLGTDPTSAFQALLRRLASETATLPLRPEDVVPRVFGLLAHARRGLEPEELAACLPDLPRNAVLECVSVLVRQIWDFVSLRDGRVDFRYASFREAALNQCDAPGASWHVRLATGLAQLVGEAFDGAPCHRLTELAWHAAHAEASAGALGNAALWHGVLKTGGVSELLGLVEDLSAIDGPLRADFEAMLSLVVDRAELLSTAPEAFDREIASWLPIDGELSRALVSSARRRARSRLLRTAGTPARLAAPAGHRAAVTAIAAPPGGRLFLSGARDGWVACWSADAARPRWMAPGHRGGVTWIATSPDGGRAVSTGAEGDVLLWDLDEGRAAPLGPARGGDAAWTYAAFCHWPAPDTVLVARGGLLYRCDPDFGGLSGGERAGFQDLSPGSERGRVAAAAGCVAVADRLGRLSVIQGGAGAARPANDLPGMPEAMAVTGSGRRVFCSDAQGRLAVVDADSGAIVAAHRGASWTALASLGEEAVGCGRDGRLYRFDASGGTSAALPCDALDELPRIVATVAASLDRARVVLGFDDGSLRLVDVTTARTQQSWLPDGALCLAATLPGGGAAGVVGSVLAGEPRSGRSLVWIDALGRRRPERSRPHRHGITGVAAGRDGRVVTVDGGGIAAVWIDGDAARVHDLGEPFGAACTWNPAGVVLCGTSDEAIVTFPVTGEPRRRATSSGLRTRVGIAGLAAQGAPMRALVLFGGGGVVYLAGEASWSDKPWALTAAAAAVDPSGRWLAAGSYDGEVALWEASSAASRRTSRVHHGQVLHLAFVSGALVTAGADRRLVVLDPETLAVRDVTVLPDLPAALTAEPDGGVTVVDASGGIHRLACEEDR